MKTGKKNNKKKKYILPKINKHDVKSLTSDYGVYGQDPSGCEMT